VDRCLPSAVASPLGLALGADVAGRGHGQGRRTVTSWLRAAGLRTGWEDFYYFLAAVGKAAEVMAMLLARLLVRNLFPGKGPLVFGIDDTPTKRYGPKVEGAGLHHNPTPGPAGQKLLYGHLWVTVAWIVHHPLWGAIGLPVLARLYVRQADIKTLPQPWPFRTKLELAKQLVLWISKVLGFLGRPLWFVTDGAYAKRPFLKVARQQPGVVIVSRLRRDAALYTVPTLVPAAQRGRGRPRTYGKRTHQPCQTSWTKPRLAAGKLLAVRQRSRQEDQDLRGHLPAGERSHPSSAGAGGSRLAALFQHRFGHDGHDHFGTGCRPWRLGARLSRFERSRRNGSAASAQPLGQHRDVSLDPVGALPDGTVGVVPTQGSSVRPQRLALGRCAAEASCASTALSKWTFGFVTVHSLAVAVSGIS
jgi:hypothetical protein